MKWINYKKKKKFSFLHRGKIWILSPHQSVLERWQKSFLFLHWNNHFQRVKVLLFLHVGCSLFHNTCFHSCTNVRVLAELLQPKSNSIGPAGSRVPLSNTIQSVLCRNSELVSNVRSIKYHSTLKPVNLSFLSSLTQSGDDHNNIISNFKFS